jgi:hypothetical protein
MMRVIAIMMAAMRRRVMDVRCLVMGVGFSLAYSYL